MVHTEPVGREAALKRVLERRAAARAQPLPVRIVLAVAGVLAMAIAIPLVVVLPELGVPLLLLALRMLAVEFDWAAHGYAWVIWRWGQVRAWFANASTPVK